MADEQLDSEFLMFAMATTETAVALEEQRSSGEASDAIRQAQKSLLVEVADSGDVMAMLKVERSLTTVELAYLGQSDVKRRSLRATLADLKAALLSLEDVQDHDYYKRLDRSMSHPKQRIGGLPRDRARMFFKAQLTRLRNLDTGRMSKSEREVLEARKYCIRAAEREYIRLQQKALGLDTDFTGVTEPAPRTPSAAWNTHGAINAGGTRCIPPPYLVDQHSRLAN